MFCYWKLRNNIFCAWGHTNLSSLGADNVLNIWHERWIQWVDHHSHKNCELQSMCLCTFSLLIKYKIRLSVFTFCLKWDLIEDTEPQLTWFRSKPQSLWNIHKEAKPNVHDKSNQRQAVYVIITGVNINYSLTICYHSWIPMGQPTVLPLYRDCDLSENATPNRDLF